MDISELMKDVGQWRQLAASHSFIHSFIHSTYRLFDRSNESFVSLPVIIIIWIIVWTGVTDAHLKHTLERLLHSTSSIILEQVRLCCRCELEQHVVLLTWIIELTAAADTLVHLDIRQWWLRAEQSVWCCSLRVLLPRPAFLSIHFWPLLSAPVCDENTE